MLLALTALDVLLYWPVAERDAPATVAFLRAALRALVCAFLYTYEVRIDAPVPAGGEPQYIHSELGRSCHVVAFLLQRVLAPDCAHIVRGAVQPLTLHALRRRLLAAAVGSEAAFASGVDNTASLNMRDRVVAQDAVAAATAAAAAAPPEASLPPVVDASEYGETMTEALALRSTAQARFETLDAAGAIRATRRLLDLLERSDLPADSLVRCDAQLQLVTALELPMHTPREASRAAMREADKAAWRDHGDALLAATREAAGILARREAAGTLLSLARHEQPLRGTMGSPYDLLSALGCTVFDNWPAAVRATPEFDDVMSLVLRVGVIEGQVCEFGLSLPHAARCESRMGARGFARAVGLLRRLVTPGERSSSTRIRTWVDAHALRHATEDAEKAFTTVPEYQNVEQSMSNFFARYQRRQEKLGLRTCGNAGCGAVEAHVGEFRTCSACKAAWYCRPECQRAAWPAHKAECKAARRAAEQAAAQAPAADE
jgi:hypothetical protein